MIKLAERCRCIRKWWKSGQEDLLWPKQEDLEDGLYFFLKIGKLSEN